jgi:RNA polymerase sigma-70 factor (ECF subfamily)
MSSFPTLRKSQPDAQTELPTRHPTGLGAAGLGAAGLGSTGRPAVPHNDAPMGPPSSAFAPASAGSRTPELDSTAQAEAELGQTAPLEFDAVVAEHGPYIWRVLRRLGVRPSDVEDVWQETFIVVHRKLDAFEGRSQLRTWLSAIAVRVASDYRNRAHRRREQATDEVPDGGSAASQHDDFVEQERRALLDRLIGELKPEQREVIVLYEFAELPMQEVAEALGCPLQTAYSRLHAGRRALEQAARRESARRGLP